MRLFITLMFCMLMIVACKTFESIETVKTEITGVEIVERDTVVFSGKAESEVKIRVDKLAKVGTIEKTNKQSKVKIVYKDNFIHANCTCDSLALEVTIRDKIINELKTIEKSQIRIDKEEVIPWLYKIMSGFGLIFLLVLIIKRKKIWA